MASEIEFTKYKTKGAYHWQQISLHPTRSNAFVKARYKHCLALLSEATGGLDDKKVLDLGCGDGVLSWLLWCEGAKSYGVDTSDLAIRLAKDTHERRGSDAEFRTISAYNSEYPDGFFHAVVSSDVIEHVREPLLLLEEIRRVLVPGGAAVISTPIRLTEQPLDPMHAAEWFPDEYKQLVRQVFPDACFSYSHPVFWMEFFHRNKLNRALINVMSAFFNPFVRNNWRFQAMQYALVKKRFEFEKP
ncbi:glycosyltransferase [Sulfurifustis variabilis]|uniref:Glycosyltransferase n=1 Tax=Sulfurifustis variabilis TaxID=1675686 RepID=A0A1B4V991_9GAMM|nr:class I SAM-dependent methyltransferase [Sulfurifustis variabilis]BAU48034.1 glycosyltransferase [Sulfurifustis variabilis]